VYKRQFINFRNQEFIKANSTKSIKADNLEHKSAGQNYVPVNASNFNPVWANRLQTVLDNVMQANPNNKGASVAVYTPEEGLWTGVSGISRPGVPITPDMRFGIGSNTKLFVAVALLKLQEEGILSLDDHLYQWLPSFKNVDSTATVRQLLTHQSGIFDYLNDSPVMIQDMWADTSRFWSANEVLATIGEPHFSPGNGYRYSNTNYLLAAMVIEAATGKTWVQNLHDLIFDPLHLDSTFVGAFETSNGPVAATWDKVSGELINNSPMTAAYSMAHGAGAILSTASEMVQWYYALFNGSIISNNSLGLLLSIDPSSLYGLGIIENEFYPHNYNHSGGILGYGSMMVFDIRRKAIMCFLFNDRYTFLEKIVPMLDVFFYEYPKRSSDVEILNIISPWEHAFSDTITPKVELKNNGSSPLTSVTLNYKVDDAVVSVFNWTGRLMPGGKIKVSLPAIKTGEGFHRFTCYTTLPNGEPEGYTFNDTLQSNFFVTTQASSIPWLFEGFDGNGFPPEGWTLNSSSILQWGVTPLARLDGSGALVANNFDGPGVIGQYRDLQLPLIKNSSLNYTDFSFDYAYSSYPDIFRDSLQVSVSLDYGETWQNLFYEGGLSLQTTSSQKGRYYPKSPGEWKHVSFSLSGFEGDILIRFRARYGFGNNLYIDNIRVGMSAYVQNLTNKYSDGRDTIKTNAVIENPNSNEISAKLIFESLDGTVSDTTEMTKFKLTDDTNWLANWETYDLAENLYWISLEVTDITNGATYTNKHFTRVTNKPLSIATLSYAEISDNKYSIKTELKYSGESKNINSPVIKVSSNDPWVKSIAPEQVSISSLKPGDIKRIPSSIFTLDEATFPGYVNLTYTISEDDWPYWTFDTTLYLVPTAVDQIGYPLSFGLEQNFPNPFNNTTTIPWQIAENSKVTLKVLDIVGRTVEILVDEQRLSGNYETQFNAATLPKGIYFCHLKAGKNVQTRKMILLE
jgi:D-alanyl-D-alanine carboxypeptidase